jgi:hypothetical protein
VVQETADLRARGVLVIIVHHGDSVFDLPFDVAAMFAATCPAMTGCLALDEVLTSRPRNEVFLKDGHWAAGGHRIAAEAIAAYLQILPGFGNAGGRSGPTVPVIGQDDPAAADSL